MKLGAITLPSRLVHRAVKIRRSVDVSGFLQHQARVAWHQGVIPFSTLTVKRGRDLVVQLPFCSPRKAAMAALALVVICTATQAFSPAIFYSEGAREVIQAVKKFDHAGQYEWLTATQKRRYDSLSHRIPDPEGFSRIPAPAGSFAFWLRHLPVAAPDRAVTTADRKIVLAADDPRLAAVVELQPHVGRLLNAPNMARRLRGEYCWSARYLDGLTFFLDAGEICSFRGWAGGLRPVMHDRLQVLEQTAEPDASRDSFCSYLETIFSFASGESLLDDTMLTPDQSISAGDLLLDHTNGHALLILDIATDEVGGLKVLIGSGGEPAQTFHVLRNVDGDPWFAISRSRPMEINGRSFSLNQLRTWRR